MNTLSNLLIQTIIQREEQLLVQGIRFMGRLTKLSHNNTKTSMYHAAVCCYCCVMSFCSGCCLSGGRRKVCLFAFIHFILFFSCLQKWSHTFRLRHTVDTCTVSDPLICWLWSSVMKLNLRKINIFWKIRTLISYFLKETFQHEVLSSHSKEWMFAQNNF